MPQVSRIATAPVAASLSMVGTGPDSASVHAESVPKASTAFKNPYRRPRGPCGSCTIPDPAPEGGAQVSGRRVVMTSRHARDRHGYSLDVLRGVHRFDSISSPTFPKALDRQESAIGLALRRATPVALQIEQVAMYSASKLGLPGSRIKNIVFEYGPSITAIFREKQRPLLISKIAVRRRSP